MVSPKNMYSDSITQWSVGQGCLFGCKYCLKSFQRQAKRQKNRCLQCYNFTPHFHPERLKTSLPNTSGDQFIWVWSSGDFSFAKPEWMEQILTRIHQKSRKQFFFQTKDPSVFPKYDWPENVWHGITLETNRDEGYDLISKAPPPTKRVINASYGRYVDVITIEPIMEFDLDIFVNFVKMLHPMRVYIGYDTKKSNLPEPPLKKTRQLIEELQKFVKVKPKLLREQYEQTGQQISCP
jgi:DNA repair photolyase